MYNYLAKNFLVKYLMAKEQGTTERTKRAIKIISRILINSSFKSNNLTRCAT